jgi:hypothetical protein
MGSLNGCSANRQNRPKASPFSAPVAAKLGNSSGAAILGFHFVAPRGINRP